MRDWVIAVGLMAAFLAAQFVVTVVTGNLLYINVLAAFAAAVVGEAAILAGGAWSLNRLTS